MKLEELEEKLGYHFQDRRLLEQALCHSSYANERHMDRLLNNERLEFLGDAVLELATSEYLYLNYRRCRRARRPGPGRASSVSRPLRSARGIWALAPGSGLERARS